MPLWESLPEFTYMARLFYFLKLSKSPSNFRQLIRSNPRKAIVRCNDLWKEIKGECNLNTESEFYRMLKYFHDTGEIYYDENDPVLCRFVVFDPQFLINAVNFLLNNKTLLKDRNRMEMLRKDFSKHGKKWQACNFSNCE